MENLKVEKGNKYKPQTPKQIKKGLEFMDNYEALCYIQDLEKEVKRLRRAANIK